MSGISAAQYLRRRLGVKVYQRVDNDTPMCVVEQNDKIVSCLEDDHFASLCFLTLKRLMKTAEETLNPVRRGYPVPPAATNITNFKVRPIVSTFDFTEFEDEVLPRLEGKTQYNAVVKEWPRVKGMKDGSEADLYEVYDWIVRLRVLMREENWKQGEGRKFKLPADVPTDVEQIGKIAEATVVRLTLSDLLPAYRAIFPESEQVTVDDQDYLVMQPERFAVNPNGFGKYVPPNIDFGAQEQAVPTNKVKSTVAAQDSSDMEVDRCLQSKVHRLLNGPVERMSTEDQEFMRHGGHPDLIDTERGGLGKASLKGLKLVVTRKGEDKEPLLSEAIARLYSHFRMKLPEVQQDHVMDLAAGRLSYMKGEFRATARMGAEGKMDVFLVPAKAH